MRSYFDAIQEIEQHPRDIRTCYFVYHEFVSQVPKRIHKYIALNDNDTLNKNKLNSLQKDQVYLSTAENFNDPYDTKAVFYKLEELKSYVFEKDHPFIINEDLSGYVYIACFTGNEENCMPMWANYANNHEGYCLEYNTKDESNIALNSSIFPVEYTEKRIDITSLLRRQLKEVSHTNNSEQLIRLLNYIATYMNCLKHKSWEYEKEYRCITFKDLPGMPYIQARPEKIFIGAKCKQENEKRLMEIGHAKNIPVYKMKFDNFSLDYKLNAEPV